MQNAPDLVWIIFVPRLVFRLARLAVLLEKIEIRSEGLVSV
jgi:hypothetical protein